MKTFRLVISCVLGALAFSSIAQDKPFELPVPGYEIRNYTCSRPTVECTIPSLSEITLEKNKFLSLADAREAVVLAEPQRWEELAMQIASLTKQSPEHSNFKQFYLAAAEEIRSIARDPKILARNSEHAEYLSRRSQIVRIFEELEAIVAKGGRLSDLPRYQMLMNEVRFYVKYQYSLYQMYRKSQRDLTGVDIWPNPVRDHQIDLSPYINRECRTQRSPFFLIGVDKPNKGGHGLTFLKDAAVIQKILDGAEGVNKPLTYRCPDNKRSSGPGKASLWLDPNANLLVNDNRVTQKDGGYFHDLSGSLEDVVNLLRKTYGNPAP